ncbi:colicin I receptor [alpha proteobacterium Q-1]|nr:colicin I receptor [alpha proteobacterium Q-1]
MISRHCKLNLAILSTLTATFGSTHAYAQIEEIIVTATKRAKSSQDIPVSVMALNGGDLDRLNVDNFTDYLKELPGVTAGGSGPGQSTIYIRGLASTTPNLTTAGVAGLAPNVAFYLDEQPLSQPGRNLDVYAVDMERIEVLPGPQGTLFGASSQAGTIRLITNKPVLNEFQVKANFGVSFTKGGEMSNKAEGVINIPLIDDKLAVRAVFYNDDQGGYIDNVAGTRDASSSARFRPEGTVRANGVPVSANRAGFQSTDDLSNVTFLEADNAELVEEDFNDTTYKGFRFSTYWAINTDWSLTVGHMRQSLESDGVFFDDPELGDMEIQRFEEDELEDDFHNTSWTLEGRLGMLDLVYTGAYTDRETDQRVDYSDYLFAGQYLPYYICDSSVTYPGAAGPVGTCQPPNLFVDSITDTEVQTHELRFTTPDSYRVYATVGGFYSDLTIKERNDFHYPGSLQADIFGSPGFFPNFPFTTGFTSDPGPFPAGVIFRNDIKRTDQQLGLFGEATFVAIPDTLEVVLGARYYDVEVDMEGSANGSFCNSFQPDINAFGTDISDVFNGDDQFTFRGSCNTDLLQTFTKGQSLDEIMAAGLSEAQANQVLNALENAPDKAKTDGVIFKATINWTPTENALLYATFSEGFRPGLLNRPGGAQGPGNFTVPFALDTDEVTNYEIGWKLDLFNNAVRFNGNAFYVDVENLQTTIFDPSIVNLFFSDNAANAEIYGMEGNISWFPMAVPGLSFTGAFSLLDTKITKVLTPTDDVRKGDDLAFAPTFQGNLRARYEWDAFDDYRAHVMPQIVYSGESFSDIITINRAEIDNSATLALAAGLTSAQWSFEVYGENLTNSRAEQANNFVFDRERTTPSRPLTIGFRVGFQM